MSSYSEQSRLFSSYKVFSKKSTSSKPKWNVIVHFYRGLLNMAKKYSPVLYNYFSRAFQNSNEMRLRIFTVYKKKYWQIIELLLIWRNSNKNTWWSCDIFFRMDSLSTPVFRQRLRTRSSQWSSNIPWNIIWRCMW